MDKDFRFLIYKSEEENASVDAVVKDDTIWLSQKGMAELFGVQVPAISKHLKRIFEEGELKEEVVVSKMEITTPHGAMPEKVQAKGTQFYNLDAIISVGYRVNSRRATRFRIWATGVLKEYMIKDFVLDDERLKQDKTAFGKDCFREYKVLVGKDHVSRKAAITKAESEYAVFNKTQKLTSDFDREVKKLIDAQ